MSKMQRDKGARVEREIVQELREIGFQNVEKIPLSGAAGGSFFGDILVDGRRVEVKARKNEWKTLIRWLEGNDWLVLRADRSEPLIVMTIKTFGDSLDERGPPPSPRAETISAERGDVAPPSPKEQPRPENERLGLTTEELDELARGLQEINDRNEMARAVREINDRTARRILKEESEGEKKS